VPGAATCFINAHTPTLLFFTGSSISGFRDLIYGVGRLHLKPRVSLKNLQGSHGRK